MTKRILIVDDEFGIADIVAEILTENDVPLDSIEAVVWSHAHFDHTGRPSLFEPKTALIVGQGTKEAFGPQKC